MRIAIKQLTKNQEGYALIIVLVFLGVTLAVMGSVMAWTSSSSKQVERNNEFETSECAADAAVENVITWMNHDFLNQALNSSNTYTSLLPSTNNWPLSYKFSSPLGSNTTYVNIGVTSPYLVPLTSMFTGLQGYEQDVKVISTATPSGQFYNVPATVTNFVQYDTIPIFQYAIFYNLDLEINPGPAMTVNGKVYCNKNIYATSDNPYLTFSNTVQSAGTFNKNRSPNDPLTGGNGSYVRFLVPGYPTTNDPVLTMPIANGSTNPAAVEAILNLPPSGSGAPNSAYLSTTNQLYLFNESDLIISNAASGTGGNSLYSNNITIWYNNTNNSPNYLSLITNDVVQIIPATNAVITGTTITTNTTGGRHPTTTYTTNYIYTIVTNGFTTNLIYSFLSNTNFYDYRIGATVQALQIDVGLFDQWLTNTATGGGNYWNLKNTTGSTTKSHAIDSIYVYNNVPYTSGSQVPAVLLTDGAQLSSTYGLTISTPQPLYVWGNYNVQTASSAANASAATYNTAYTYPAALMGDSLTILSANWSPTRTKYSSSPAATTTTVNAAMLEGIVVSSSGNNPAGQHIYSGGVQNFVHFLESWSGVTSWINGSIVVLFPCQYDSYGWEGSPSSANGYTSGGGYYSPPARNWAFDNNFTNQTGMPPLSPQIKSMLRTPGAWSAN